MAFACSLGYLDLQVNGDWRQRSPEPIRWHDGFANRFRPITKRKHQKSMREANNEKGACLKHAPSKQKIRTSWRRPRVPDFRRF